jgi:class 3 adenylate cyclase/tetratricopeptide (TPR) repeat protein
MKCLKCHFQNPEGLTLCSKCGAELEKVCPRCSFRNPPQFKFCGECGHGLNFRIEPSPRELSFDEKLRKIQRYLPTGLTEKILSQRDKIEGEHKQVTVMFCDMKGFTPLAEKLGPEKVYAMMDQIYEILIHKVHEYEGTVNEMTGDGIMALFGAPIALEDASQRAIRSAMAIHREMTRFNENTKQEKVEFPPVKMRIGINTGHVVVGTLGNDLRVEFKAVGDTVNLAARTEQLAEPGTTYVTEETYRLTKDFFHFSPLGKIAVKGKEKPIPVYKVLSAREDVQRPRLGSERRIYSTMVGREIDLNRLEFQVTKAINGEGSVVNIIGEAGIGKSRLLAELKRREVMKRVTLLEGRAISIGRNLSFHPVIELLKHWAMIRRDDGETKAFDRLQAAVRRLFPEEYGEILPFVATLMGMKLSGRHAERLKGIEGEPLKKLITKSVRNLLAKAAEVSPLVIAGEDLHWADTSSIELMESLFRLAEPHRVVFLNLFRPGYKETGDRIVNSLKETGQVYYVEIVLEPLSRKLSEALVRNMLRISELHQTFVTSIAERTGGNPFFIEEVVRSLIDEQALVPKDGTVHLTERATSIQIPATVEDVLMARIDRLEEPTRDLVKIASVIGRSFFYRVLLEVASVVDDIDSRLSYLEEIQILRKRFRMGEVEYLFNHALVQEVAYRSILLTKLKDLHLNVARSIEKIFDERLHEFYGMLAYHYSRGESLEKAEEYLIKAGEEALQSSASNEALQYYQEALGIYQKLQGNRVDPEKVAMLEKNIGLALFNRGQYAEAVERFDKVLNYYWGELPKNALSTALRFLSSFTTFLLALYFPSFWFKKIPTEQDAEVVDLFHKKTDALVVINPKRIFIESFFFFDKMVRFDLTKFKLGIAIFVGASAMFSFTGLSHRIGRRILDYAKPMLAPDDARQRILYDLMDTQHLFLKGKWNEITECNEDLVNRNLNIGEMFYACQHYYWHGLPKIYQGHFDAARLIVTKLSEIAEAYENDIYRLLKYLLNINLLIECRNFKEATAEVHRGIDLVKKNSMLLSELTMQSLKASIHLLMKETEQAGKSLDRASRIRPEVKAVPIQLSFFYRSQFEYYLHCLEDSLRNGNRQESSEYRRNAFKSGKMLLKTCQKAALYRTESYRLMGTYNWLTHDRKSAFKWWHKAISEGERLGARPYLSRIYAEMGMRLGAVRGESPGPDGNRSQEFIQKAKTMFLDLGLSYDLENLNSMINRMGLEPSEDQSLLTERQEK